jgi:NTE family protein
MLRRGLVLGAGGILGAAWTVGALEALREQSGWDPTVDVPEILVGTSAGSVLAATIACGATLEELVANQRGSGGARFDYEHDESASALPPRPRLRLGSAGLLRNVALHPRRFTPATAIAGLLPAGRGSLAPVRRLVDSALEFSGSTGWPGHPTTLIVTTDYETGRRVVFGRPGSPDATLTDAVVASCSIPAWYEPVQIGGHRYVDGGICSSTSVDLLAGAGLDEVWVLAPMADAGLDHPRDVITRVERRYRRSVTRRMEREAAKVRASGTTVHLLAPGPQDLRVMGANLMDPSRRLPVFEQSVAGTQQVLAGRLAS